MRVCPKCGAESDTRFCPECGNEMIEIDKAGLPSTQAEMDVKRCPRCGYEGTVAYCPECGSEMIGGERAFSPDLHPMNKEGINKSSHPQNQKPVRSKSKKPFIAGAVLVAIIIAVVIGFAGNKDASPENESAYNETTSEASSYSDADTYSDEGYDSDYGPTLSGSWHCVGAFLKSEGVLTVGQMSSAGFDVSISLSMYSDNTYSMYGFLSTTTDSTDLDSTGAYVFDGDKMVFTDDREGKVLGIGGYDSEEDRIMITFSENPSEDDMYLILEQ